MTPDQPQNHDYVMSPPRGGGFTRSQARVADHNQRPRGAKARCTTGPQTPALSVSDGGTIRLWDVDAAVQAAQDAGWPLPALAQLLGGEIKTLRRTYLLT